MTEKEQKQGQEIPKRNKSFTQDNAFVQINPLSAIEGDKTGNSQKEKNLLH